MRIIRHCIKSWNNLYCQWIVKLDPKFVSCLITKFHYVGLCDYFFSVLIWIVSCMLIVIAYISRERWNIAFSFFIFENWDNLSKLRVVCSWNCIILVQHYRIVNFSIFVFTFSMNLKSCYAVQCIILRHACNCESGTSLHKNFAV